VKIGLVVSLLQAIAKKEKETRMWASAQHDGRHAELWRPVFNAAKFG